MKFKYTLDPEAEFSNADFAKKNTADYREELTPLYPDHRPISKEKKQDLLRLLVYIPPIYHEFYKNITDATSVTTHLYEDEMLNDSEDESKENQFHDPGNIRRRN